MIWHGRGYPWDMGNIAQFGNTLRQHSLGTPVALGYFSFFFSSYLF